MPDLTQPSWRSKYRESLVQSAGDGLLDIPHLDCLSGRSLEQLLGQFTQKWGFAATGVALPVVATDGVNVAESTFNLPRSRGSMLGVSLGDLAVAAVDAGANDVWLVVEPGFNFIAGDNLSIVDSDGVTASQLCAGRPASQDLIAITIADALYEVETRTGQGASVALDLVDLWPIGANDGRIKLTCMCAHCTRSMAELGAEDLARTLRKFPNPLNLLLRENEYSDGIKYEDRVVSTMDPSEIASVCVQRQFWPSGVPSSDGELSEFSQQLMSFLRARHDYTVRMVQGIFRRVADIREQPVGRKAIITDGVAYNWSNGLFADRLDDWAKFGSTAPIDEVWCDPTEHAITYKNLTYRSYMWKRTRYSVDAFFQFVSSVQDPRKRASTGLGRMVAEEASRVARHRGMQALAGEIGQLIGLASLERDDRRAGFVACGLDRKAVDDILASVRVTPDFARN